MDLRILISFFAAFLASSIFGKYYIPWLKKKNANQPLKEEVAKIYEDNSLAEDNSEDKLTEQGIKRDASCSKSEAHANTGCLSNEESTQMRSASYEVDEERYSTNMSFFEGYKVKEPSELDIVDRWKANANCARFTAPIFVVEKTGERYSFDINPFGERVCSLLIGNAGSGKTESLKTLLLSLAANYSANNLNYYIFDNWAGEYELFAKLPQCGCWVKDASHEIKSCIAMLRKEVLMRQEYVEYKHKSRDFNESKPKSMPALLVIIDTADGYFWQDQKDSFLTLSNVIKDSIGLGIYFVFASHPGAADPLIRAMASEIDSKWFFSGLSERAVLNNSPSHAPWHCGACTICLSSGEQKSVYCFHSWEEKNAVIKNICQLSG